MVNLRSLWDDIATFRAMFPHMDARTLAHHWADMIREEPGELEAELRADPQDPAKICQEAVDTVWVTIGAAQGAGVTYEQFVAMIGEVSRANLAKDPPAQPGGKARKPPGWEGPNLVLAMAAEERPFDLPLCTCPFCTR